MMRITKQLVIAGVLSANFLLPAYSKDSDGDGLTDVQEKELGTFPDLPERFTEILVDDPESEKVKKSKTYDASKDIQTLEFCHVGADRYMWRVTFAEAPNLENTVFHLYVDADSDGATGRKGDARSHSTGTEHMISYSGGNPVSSSFDAAGNKIIGPTVHYVVSGKSLILSADIKLGRDDKGINYSLYVLCHSATVDGKKGMSDSIAKTSLKGVPVTDRDKIRRVSDFTKSDRVHGRYGLDSIHKILADPANLLVHHDAFELDGFKVDPLTSRRFPHVRLEGRAGKVWTKVPKPGSYHVALLMYDDNSDEKVGIFIEGQLKGVAVARQDNKRTWLYWLDQAYDFKGGEKVTLKSGGSSGKHGISKILFLPKAPKARAIEYAVANMETAVLPSRPNEFIVSWTTSMPSLTRFEFGTSKKYGKLSEGKTERLNLVHRVVLDKLKLGATYHGRAIGNRPNGSAYQGADLVFKRELVKAPPTVEKTGTIPLTVNNAEDWAAHVYPVTTGVPFPKGLLASVDHLRLLKDGKEVPAQIEVRARWRDASIKWVLLNFQAEVQAKEKAVYHLEYGRSVTRAKAGKSFVSLHEGGVMVDTGKLKFLINQQGELVLNGKVCRTILRGSDGKTYKSSQGKASVEIEDDGFLRAVIKTSHVLAAKDGIQSFRIEKRVEVWRNSESIRVKHRFVNTLPKKFTNIEELTYLVPKSGGSGEWHIETMSGKDLVMKKGSTTALSQLFDQEITTLTKKGKTAAAGRLVGIAQTGGENALTVSLRDFWQNYPKGFELSDEGLKIALCPDFEEGRYDAFPFEKEGNQLYYYLSKGRYQLKSGVSKTHDLLLSLAGAEEAAAQARFFQKPLLATATPQWYCGSQVFYDVLPRDEENFGKYEQAVDLNIEGYEKRREKQHDFGMLNYGDWYGERKVNWGNIEYDTQHAFFLEYIRSGNGKAFFLGEAAELHNRDVDVVHWSEDGSKVGGVYVHQMGHVGGYFDKPVPGTLGFPEAGFTISHAWVEGHFEHYFLTGDRRSLETGRAIADYFIKKSLSAPYDFNSCRVPGWHLILNASAYASTGDPYYLNASRVIVDRVLATQDKIPRPLPEYQKKEKDGRVSQVGGWTRMLVPGHCRCEERHQGNANFMIAILLSGLKYYHDVTGDPEVKEAMIKGAHYLVDEFYSEEKAGFRYTSCTKMNYRAGASPLMVEGVARAYRWTDDENFKHVLTKGLAAGAGGSSYGKSFSQYYRAGPRVLADLKAVGLGMEEGK